MAELLDPVEEAFDEAACLVKEGAEAAQFLAVAHRRDVRACFSLLDHYPRGVGVIALSASSMAPSSNSLINSAAEAMVASWRSVEYQRAVTPEERLIADWSRLYDKLLYAICFMYFAITLPRRIKNLKRYINNWHFINLS